MTVLSGWRETSAVQGWVYYMQSITSTLQSITITFQMFKSVTIVLNGMISCTLYDSQCYVVFVCAVWLCYTVYECVTGEGRDLLCGEPTPGEPQKQGGLAAGAGRSHQGLSNLNNHKKIIAAIIIKIIILITIPETVVIVTISDNTILLLIWIWININMN